MSLRLYRKIPHSVITDDKTIKISLAHVDFKIINVRMLMLFVLIHLYAHSR